MRPRLLCRLRSLHNSLEVKQESMLQGRWFVDLPCAMLGLLLFVVSALHWSMRTGRNKACLLGNRHIDQAMVFACYFIFLIFSRFSSSEASVVLSFSSCAGSFSSLIFACTSLIFANTVDSSPVSMMDLVASSAVCPSLITSTRFWHLAHHSSPLFSLNSGDAQAGHDSSVSVAPCLSRSAMFCRSFCLFVTLAFVLAKRF